LADFNPYRGGPKGRVKWKSTKFGNFFRDQATIVPMLRTLKNPSPMTPSGALSGLIDWASPGMLVAWQITSSSEW
jgi:hypothetical protein